MQESSLIPDNRMQNGYPQSYGGPAMSDPINTLTNQILFPEKTTGMMMTKGLQIDNVSWHDFSEYEFIFEPVYQDEKDKPDHVKSLSVFKPKSANYGLKLVYRQEWRPLGNQRGEIVKTIPLGPKQVERVSSKVLRRSKVFRTSESHKDVESQASSAESTKDSGELVQEAVNNFNWYLDAEASVSFKAGFVQASGNIKAGMSGECTEKVKETNKKLSEVMRKSSSKMRSETKIVVSTESESSFESSTASEIQNPNEEIPITYVYSKLQRQYEVLTSLQEVQPVVLVALDLPEKIDIEWVKKHDWILSKVLLDESFRDALNSISMEPDQAVDTSEKQIKEYSRNRLFEHIKANIFHYMRAIWSQEDPQQRILRFKDMEIKVPRKWTFKGKFMNTEYKSSGSEYDTSVEDLHDDIINHEISDTDEEKGELESYIKERLDEKENELRKKCEEEIRGNESIIIAQTDRVFQEEKQRLDGEYDSKLTYINNTIDSEKKEKQGDITKKLSSDADVKISDATVAIETELSKGNEKKYAAIKESRQKIEALNANCSSSIAAAQASVEAAVNNEINLKKSELQALQYKFDSIKKEVYEKLIYQQNDFNYWKPFTVDSISAQVSANASISEFTKAVLDMKGTMKFHCDNFWTTQAWRNILVREINELSLAETRAAEGEAIPNSINRINDELLSLLKKLQADKESAAARVRIDTQNEVNKLTTTLNSLNTELEGILTKIDNEKNSIKAAVQKQYDILLVSEQGKADKYYEELRRQQKDGLDAYYDEGLAKLTQQKTIEKQTKIEDMRESVLKKYDAEIRQAKLWLERKVRREWKEDVHFEGDFEPVKGTEIDITEMINPAGPIGYYGNYAIFYLKTEGIDNDIRTILDILKMPYYYYTSKDNAPVLVDPMWKRLIKDYRGIVPNSDERVEMVEYVPQLRLMQKETADSSADNPMAMQVILRNDALFAKYYPEYLFRKELTTRFVVDTNNLVLDVEAGRGSVLEPFRLAQRGIDVQKSLEQKEQMRLENIRRKMLIEKQNVEDKSWFSNYAQPVTNDNGNGKEQLTAAPPAKSIYGKIQIYRKQAGIQGATIVAKPEDTSSLGTNECRAVSSQDGTYELKLAPGSYTLTASADGYLPESKQVTFNELQQLETVFKLKEAKAKAS